MNLKFKHASFFSGIGGFDLAARWMGWKNVFQVEKDKWCLSKLQKNFPNTVRYQDIKDFSGYGYTNSIDIISGGFPCQPFSVAGKQRSKDDDRYLWPQMLRCIDEIRPTWFVGENVPGIIGLALDTVLSDLEDKGYQTETFIIPACAKNAWHRRDRVWIVAHSNDKGNNRTPKQTCQPHEKMGLQERIQMEFALQPGCVPANAQHNGFVAAKVSTGNGPDVQNPAQGAKSTEQPQGMDKPGHVANTNNAGCQKQRFTVADGAKLFAPKCSSWWQAEPRVGRVADGVPNRVDRIKGLGNAIVPIIAYQIFCAIQQYEQSPSIVTLKS